MYIKTYDKETCIRIGAAIEGTEDFHDADWYLYFLPDSVFNKEMEARLESLSAIVVDENDGLEWRIPWAFIYRISEERNDW